MALGNKTSYGKADGVADGVAQNQQSPKKSRQRVKAQTMTVGKRRGTSTGYMTGLS